jgi:hypothetical protein
MREAQPSVQNLHPDILSNRRLHCAPAASSTKEDRMEFKTEYVAAMRQHVPKYLSMLASSVAAAKAGAR